MSGREIEFRAQDIAEKLDRGQGQIAADMLRDDAARNPRDFMNIVNRTNQLERNGRGDDLNVQQTRGYNGLPELSITVTATGMDQYGRRGRFTEPVASVPLEQPRHNHPPQQRQEQGIDPTSAVIGGVIGLGVGIILNNQNRHDRHRR
jgi:hypothetical protein